MKIYHLDQQKLKVLSETFDGLLSDINMYIWKMNQSSGVEYYAFYWILDIKMFESFVDNLLSNEEKREVISCLEKLKHLWNKYKYWYCDDRLLTYDEWKTLYNKQAVIWKSILLA